LIIREEPAVTGQRVPVGIDLGHDVIKQPSLDHRVHRVPRRRLRI
jgi:hypothetical protein